MSTHRIVQVFASKHHSLALSVDGRLFSWGHGKAGRLGHGSEDSFPEPTLITLLSDLGICIVAVSTAENHTLAVDSNGDVYSWGSNRFGQLGQHVAVSSSDAAGASCLQPKRIESLRKFHVVGAAAGAAV